MDIALADESFLRNHGIRVRGQQIDQLRAEILQLPGRYTIRIARDAAAVASQVGQARQSADWLERNGDAAGIHLGRGRRVGSLLCVSHGDQLRDIYSQIEGNFVGLGVELKADKGALQIVHVIPHSPAEKSGIHDGDRITAVDGQATKSLSTDEAASL